MNYANGEDLLAQIGAGKISAKLVGTRLIKLHEQGRREVAAEPKRRGAAARRSR